MNQLYVLLFDNCERIDSPEDIVGIYTSRDTAESIAAKLNTMPDSTIYCGFYSVEPYTLNKTKTSYTKALAKYGITL